MNQKYDEIFHIESNERDLLIDPSVLNFLCKCTLRAELMFGTECLVQKFFLLGHAKMAKVISPHSEDRFELLLVIIKMVDLH